VSERPQDPHTPDDATVERLREAFRASDAPEREGEPVDADRIWLAVTGESSPEERREVIARVAADPAWATAWRLAHALSQAAANAPQEAPTALAPTPDTHAAANAPQDASATLAPTPDTRARRDTGRPGARARRFRFAWSRPAWGAVATAALVLIVVGVSLQPGNDTPTVRGGDTLAVVSRLPEEAPLPRADLVLRWSEGPAGTRWALQLSSEDLSLVHRADSLATSEYRVPAEVLAALPAGTKLLWQVEARLPDGRVQRSATFVNRIQ
jgi:hypothetical protein